MLEGPIKGHACLVTDIKYDTAWSCWKITEASRCTATYIAVRGAESGVCLLLAAAVSLRGAKGQRFGAACPLLCSTPAAPLPLEKRVACPPFRPVSLISSLKDCLNALYLAWLTSLSVTYSPLLKSGDP